MIPEDGTLTYNSNRLLADCCKLGIVLDAGTRPCLDDLGARNIMKPADCPDQLCKSGLEFYFRHSRLHLKLRIHKL